MEGVFSLLRSRKAAVALATVLTILLGKWGLNLDSETIGTLVALGIALILAIAHEDASEKRAGDDSGAAPETPAGKGGTDGPAGD